MSKKHRDLFIDLDKYNVSRNAICDELGRDWLNKEIDIYHNYIKQLRQTYGKNYIFYEREDKYHPLAKLWHSDSIFDALKIMELYTLLETLKNYEGFKNKKAKLKTSPREFEKLIYEFRIGYEFNKLGWQISFPETPDIIVTSGGCELYIECKKKDLYGRNEKQKRNIFRNIASSVMNKIRKLQRPYIIIIKCKTSIKPKDSPIVERLIKDSMIRSRKYYSDEEFDIIIINIESDTANIPLIDYPMNTEMEIKERLIYSLTKSIVGTPIYPDFYVFNDGIRIGNNSLSLKNLKFIGFISNESLNRFASIENSFDEAIRQIPEGKHGLVYIELDSYISPYEIKEISGRLNGKLRAHARVNSANLTREILERTTGGEYVKGTYYTRIANELAVPIPDDLMIPGIGGKEIDDEEIKRILGDMAKKYSPEGTLRPFNKKGTSVLIVFNPESKNKIQYYIDMGEVENKNRCSLLYDGNSNLILKINSFNEKCYSLEVPLEKERFFGNYHVIICTFIPIMGKIKIDINGIMHEKKVDSFYLEDVAVVPIIGSDISKTHFAKMQCVNIGIWPRELTEGEVESLLNYFNFIRPSDTTEDVIP